MVGARALAALPNCALTLAFVCAHICECLFKAFLLWKGVPEPSLKAHQVRHDLSALRAMTVVRGLAVNANEPQWLGLLSSLHESPFQLRYPVGLNGVVSPGPQP